MINNLSNLKNSIMLWIGGAIAILLAILKIRKGGADAQKQKYTEATLENVAKAKCVEIERFNQLNNPNERKRLRAKWTRPSK